MSIKLRTALAAIFGVAFISGCELIENIIPTDDNAEEEAELIYETPKWAEINVGKIPCAKGKFFTVVRADIDVGVDINWEGRHYTLERVATSTGAYRYEDKNSGIVLLQTPEKAQLLNAKLGQRLADECRP